MKPKQAVRSLATPLRMFDGMDEEETPKKQVEVLDGPVLSERDRAKIERRKRKDERQREVSAVASQLKSKFLISFFVLTISYSVDNYLCLVL